jgi:hypothetical protein
VRRQPYRPILITDAERSQDEQLRKRQIRYVLMMSVRAACLVIGAMLVGAKAPLLWLWLPLCAVGMVLIPWLAVLLANDRPPKDRHRLVYRLHPHHEAPAARVLPANDGTHRTVDGDTVGGGTVDAGTIEVEP